MPSRFRGWAVPHLCAERARELLGSDIRGLLNAVPFDDVKVMIERIVGQSGVWPQAIEGVNRWLYFDRRNASNAIAKQVRALFDQLMPADPVELVVLYTHGWQSDFHNPDADYDADDQTSYDFEYSVRELGKLAEIIVRDATMLDSTIERLVTSDAKTVFPFARRLAVLASDPLNLFTKALRIAEVRTERANGQFFGGLVTGTDDRDPHKARQCVRKALQSPKLKEYAISMIGSGKLQPDDLSLVISLLQSGDVEPSQCAPLSHGRGLDHFFPEQIMPFLDELGRHGFKGHWAVVHIVSMYLHGGNPLSTAVVEKSKSTLLARDFFENAPDQMDCHHFEQVVKLLLKYGQLDRNFAAAPVKQLLSICRHGSSEVFYPLKRPVRSVMTSLLPLFPHEVWREVSKYSRRKTRCCAFMPTISSSPTMAYTSAQVCCIAFRLRRILTGFERRRPSGRKWS